MRPRLIDDERGITIAIVLFLMTIMTALTAAAFSISRTEIQTSRNYRSGTQALYAAEAGMAHAIAIINQVGVVNLQNDVYNVWTDHKAPFDTNPQAMAQRTNYSYDVVVAMDPYRQIGGAQDPNRGVLTATAVGMDNSARTVVARVVKSGVPAAPPGAMYLATDNPSNATFNGNNFSISGNDQNLDNTAGPQPAVPGITARTQANAQETRDSLSDTQKNNVQGLGYVPGPPNPATPSVAATQGATTAQIDRMIDDLLALPHDTVTGSHINGGGTYGTVAAPKITYMPGDGSGVTFGNGNATGAGILIVENALTINGNLDFKGLILVRGTTQVTDVTGSATIWGSVWTTDFNLTIGGHADIQYSSQALALANLAGGGTGGLPAPVVVTAWRDVF